MRCWCSGFFFLLCKQAEHDASARIKDREAQLLVERLQEVEEMMAQQAVDYDLNNSVMSSLLATAKIPRTPSATAPGDHKKVHCFTGNASFH